MTKRIPNPKRLLDMEERLLTRLQQERDAAYAVFREKDTALMRQRQIVALKRGERPPLAEWTPDGEYRPFRTESLVGQPGVAQVPVLTDNAPNGGDWKEYHEEQRKLAEETAASHDEIRERLAEKVAANAAEAERDKPLEISVGTAVHPDAVSRSFSSCIGSIHRFSAAPNLPIGTPCFCGARAWGVDPAKEGAKP